MGDVAKLENENKGPILDGYGFWSAHLVSLISEGIEAKATEEPGRKGLRSLQLTSGLHRANVMLVLLPWPREGGSLSPLKLRSPTRFLSPRPRRGLNPSAALAAPRREVIEI